MSSQAVDEKQLSPRSPTSLNATRSWSSDSTANTVKDDQDPSLLVKSTGTPSSLIVTFHENGTSPGYM
jgi:hypothetical protein